MNLLNKITISLLVLISILFSGCQFNKSVNTDIQTGAYYRSNGISCDEVAIEINGGNVSRNEFVFGEKVTLVFKNLRGLKKIKGKKYPKVSMYIIKNDRDTVLNRGNLLKDFNSGTVLEPLDLYADFIAALPNKNNEKYKALVVIKDRRGDGDFKYELPFTITDNSLLTITNDNIQYSNIYLWNETLKQPVIDSRINIKESYVLILDGIEGLLPIRNKVFPVFSIELVDNLNNKIISNPNLLSAYEISGVNPDDLKVQLTSKLSFSNGAINNPCTLTVNLKDNNSSKAILIRTQLEIK